MKGCVSGTRNLKVKYFILSENNALRGMKKIVLYLACISLIWACSSENDITEDPVFENTLKSAEFVSTNNAFGLDLFSGINALEKEPNLMVSPASVSLALGMAYNGAESSTREAFETLLNYEGLSREEINAISRELILQLVTNSEGNLLEIANSIWYREGFPVKQGFLDLNSTYFSAEVDALDFSDPSAIATINDWVKKQTHDKIDKIIEELSPEAMMVLVNALYFNCTWEIEFDKELTESKVFYTDQGGEFDKVKMMVTENTFRYAQSEAFSAVELPYKNEKFSMYLFLPAYGTSVNDLIGTVNGEAWKSWMEEFQQNRSVQVSLPKFKFDYKRSIGNDLQSMGLEIAFTDHADFSGISDIDLFISEVVHKTYIEVNEEGTEAAAVTGIVFETTGVGNDPGPLVITFNRPFLFAISENTSKSIVFIGKVSEPEYEE
jgi:serpin B